MTTLAWNGKVLATDSQATQHEMVMLYDHKKIFTPTDEQYWEIQGQRILAIALCGNPEALPYIFEELQKGVTHRTRIVGPEYLDFLIMAVSEQGICWYWGVDRNHRRPVDMNVLSPNAGPCSAGSGQIIAHAVMSVTGSSVKAIEQAIRLDVSSGGEVQTWTHPGVPEVLSKRPLPQLPENTPFTPEQVKEIVDAAIRKANAVPKCDPEDENGSNVVRAQEDIKQEVVDAKPAGA
jgi:hypothetical protein